MRLKFSPKTERACEQLSRNTYREASEGSSSGHEAEADEEGGTIPLGAVSRGHCAGLAGSSDLCVGCALGSVGSAHRFPVRSAVRAARDRVQPRAYAESAAVDALPAISPGRTSGGQRSSARQAARRGTGDNPAPSLCRRPGAVDCGAGVDAAYLEKL